MAKKRKYPKRPKMSASLGVWKNYETRCREVDQYNAQIERDKKSKAGIIKKVKQKY